MQKVTIIGAGYAGLLAAFRLQKGADVTLINAEESFIERIRLHQVAAGQKVKARRITDMVRGTGIHFIQGKVTHIEPDQHALTLENGQTLPYETLVYALGSTTDMDAVPGLREYAYTCTPKSVGQLKEHIKKNGRLIVVGGGLTGIEAAAEFAESYPELQVTLITRGRLGADLSLKARDYLVKTFARLGVTLQEDTTVQHIESGVVVTAQGAFATDHVLWAGAFGVSPLAREAGVAVNDRGQIIVDAMLRSMSHPDIYAAGDSAVVPGIRMACATAMPMGGQVADNILKGDKAFRFSYIVRCISLGRRDGLVQFVGSDDTPKERILTGRTGAVIKEMICRGTLIVLMMERRLPGIYRSPKSDAVATRELTYERGTI